MPTYTGQRMMKFLIPITLIIHSLKRGSRALARLFTLPVVPDPKRRRTPRISDRRYIEGQKLLVEAMKYLVQTDPESNRDAIGLLSEHFRTQFRMSDRPVAE